MNYKISSGGKEVRINCPFCPSVGKPPDRKYHLYINRFTGDWHCFRCGRSGRSLRGLPIEVTLDLMPVFSLDVKQSPMGEDHLDGNSPPLVLQETLTEYYFCKQSSSCRTMPSFIYFHSRISSYFQNDDPPIPGGYVYFDISDPFSVYILSRTLQGDVDYFVSRSVKKSSIKYRNPHGKKPLFKVLFWLPEFSESYDASRIFVVEGPMDALVVSMRTSSPSVALLGSYFPSFLSDSDYSLFTDKEVVLWMDPDVPPKKVAKIARQIDANTLCSKLWVVPNSEKDPADSGGLPPSIISLSEFMLLYL